MDKERLERGEKITGDVAHSERERDAGLITEGEKRLERVLGTDEGKMTWR